MTYSSRLDWSICAGILLTVGAVLIGADYWFCGPVLIVLLLCAYPKRYETAPAALMVHEPLTTRRIPYGVITCAARDRRGVRVRFGLASEIRLQPADPDGFLSDVAQHTPHLTRRGEQLVLRDRHVEYSFAKPRRAYGMP